MDRKLISDLLYWAKKIYRDGYVVAKGGNISARSGDVIYIKRSGVSMENLTSNDIVTVNIERKEDAEASIDYHIHREIYLNTDSNVVIHAHPKYIISLSIYQENYFEPIDFESRYYLGKIPIVKGDHFAVHKDIGRYSIENNVIIEKSHGVYIHGKTFEDCYRLLELSEHAAEIFYLYTLSKR
jgi:L-fuculose-phosphate aldolase